EEVHVKLLISTLRSKKTEPFAEAHQAPCICLAFCKLRKIKECSNKLCLFIYGKLSNVLKAIYMQHLMKIDGVIVDLVKEIIELVLDINDQGMEEKLQVKN
ncbi:hypothetical protein HN51_044851, partial [Arachis hypogaea]